MLALFTVSERMVLDMLVFWYENLTSPVPAAVAAQIVVLAHMSFSHSRAATYGRQA